MDNTKDLKKDDKILVTKDVIQNHIPNTRLLVEIAEEMLAEGKPTPPKNNQNKKI